MQVGRRARWSREAIRHSFVLTLVLFLASTASPAFALSTSPGEILANPDRYDGQPVTIRGTVKNLRETVSRRGNAYYTFDLDDETRAIKVFSFGNASCKAGAPATVEGTYQKVKRQGRYTFYNEVEAASVTCR